MPPIMNKGITELSALQDSAEIIRGEHKIRLEKAILEEDGVVHRVRFIFRNLDDDREESRTWSTTGQPGGYTVEGDEMPFKQSSESSFLSALDYYSDKLDPADLLRIKEHLGVVVSEARVATKDVLK